MFLSLRSPFGRLLRSGVGVSTLYPFCCVWVSPVLLFMSRTDTVYRYRLNKFNTTRGDALMALRRRRAVLRLLLVTLFSMNFLQNWRDGIVLGQTEVALVYPCPATLPNVGLPNGAAAVAGSLIIVVPGSQACGRVADIEVGAGLAIGAAGSTLAPGTLLEVANVSVAGTVTLARIHQGVSVTLRRVTAKVFTSTDRQAGLCQGSTSASLVFEDCHFDSFLVPNSSPIQGCHQIHVTFRNCTIGEWAAGSRFPDGSSNVTVTFADSVIGNVTSGTEFLYSSRDNSIVFQAGSLNSFSVASCSPAANNRLVADGLSLAVAWNMNPACFAAISVVPAETCRVDPDTGSVVVPQQLRGTYAFVTVPTGTIVEICGAAGAATSVWVTDIGAGSGLLLRDVAVSTLHVAYLGPDAWLTVSNATATTAVTFGGTSPRTRIALSNVSVLGATGSITTPRFPTDSTFVMESVSAFAWTFPDMGGGGICAGSANVTIVAENSNFTRISASGGQPIMWCVNLSLLLRNTNLKGDFNGNGRFPADSRNVTLSFVDCDIGGQILFGAEFAYHSNAVRLEILSTTAADAAASAPPLVVRLASNLNRGLAVASITGAAALVARGLPFDVVWAFVPSWFTAGVTVTPRGSLCAELPHYRASLSQPLVATPLALLSVDAGATRSLCDVTAAGAIHVSRVESSARLCMSNMTAAKGVGVAETLENATVLLRGVWCGGADVVLGSAAAGSAVVLTSMAARRVTLPSLGRGARCSLANATASQEVTVGTLSSGNVVLLTDVTAPLLTFAYRFCSGCANVSIVVADSVIGRVTMLSTGAISGATNVTLQFRNCTILSVTAEGRFPEGSTGVRLTFLDSVVANVTVGSEYAYSSSGTTIEFFGGSLQRFTARDCWGARDGNTLTAVGLPLAVAWQCEPGCFRRLAVHPVLPPCAAAAAACVENAVPPSAAGGEDDTVTSLSEASYAFLTVPPNTTARVCRVIGGGSLFVTDIGAGGQLLVRDVHLTSGGVMHVAATGSGSVVSVCNASLTRLSLGSGTLAPNSLLRLSAVAARYLYVSDFKSGAALYAERLNATYVGSEQNNANSLCRFQRNVTFYLDNSTVENLAVLSQDLSVQQCTNVTVAIVRVVFGTAGGGGGVLDIGTNFPSSSNNVSVAIIDSRFAKLQIGAEFLKGSSGTVVEVLGGEVGTSDGSTGGVSVMGTGCGAPLAAGVVRYFPALPTPTPAKAEAVCQSAHAPCRAPSLRLTVCAAPGMICAGSGTTSAAEAIATAAQQAACGVTSDAVAAGRMPSAADDSVGPLGTAFAADWMHRWVQQQREGGAVDARPELSTVAAAAFAALRAARDAEAAAATALASPASVPVACSDAPPSHSHSASLLPAPEPPTATTTITATDTTPTDVRPDGTTTGSEATTEPSLATPVPTTRASSPPPASLPSSVETTTSAGPASATASLPNATAANVTEPPPGSSPAAVADTRLPRGSGTAIAEAVAASSAIVGTLGGIVGQRSAGAQGLRLVAAGAAVRCAFDDRDTAPSYIEMPLQWDLGASPLRRFTSGLLSTLAIIAAACGALAWRFIAAVGLEFAGLETAAGAFAIASSYFVPIAAAASATLAAHADGAAYPGDVVVAVVAALATAALLVAIGVAIAVVVPRCVVGQPRGPGRPLDFADRARSDGQAPRPVCAALQPLLDGSTTIAAGQLARFAFVEDVAAAVVASAAAGTRPSSHGACVRVAAVVLAVNVAHVAYLVGVRPLARRLDAGFALVGGVGSVVVAAVALACALQGTDTSEVSSPIEVAYTAASMTLAGLFFLQAAVNVAYYAYLVCIKRRPEQSGAEAERDDRELSLLSDPPPAVSKNPLLL